MGSLSQAQPAADVLFEKGKQFISPPENQAPLFDSAAHYFRRAIPLYAAADSLERWLLCYAYLQRAAMELHGPLRALSILDSALNRLREWREPRKKMEQARLGSLYMQYGFNANELGDYHAARQAYENCREIFEQLEGYHYLLPPYIYQPLGMIYWRLGNYQLAEYYISKVIEEAQNKPDGETLAQALSDFALITQSSGNYELAMQNYQRAMNQAGIGREALALLHVNLGALYLEIRQPQAAITHLRQGIGLFNRSGLSKKAAVPHRLLGLAYTLADKFDEAESQFRQAVSLASSLSPSDHAHIFLNWGDMYTGQQQYEEALARYQMALHLLIPRLDSLDIWQQPSAALFYPEPKILEVLVAKGSALYYLYQQKGELKYLELAFTSYQLAKQMEAQLLTYYDNEASKLHLLEQSHIRTEMALNIAHELYQRRSEDTARQAAVGKLMRQVFELFEGSKSHILLESVRELEAQMQSQLPDSLEQQLYRLKAHWRYCERHYQAEQAKWPEIDEQSLSEWNDQRVQAEMAYRQFLARLEKNYAGYVQIKQSQEATSLEEIQQEMLDADQALLTYFEGDARLYLLIITPAETYFLQLQRPDELESWVQGFLQSVSTYDLHQSAAYVRYGRLLYQTLVQPMADAGIVLPSRIKIIPDGLLSYLPFGALLSAEPDQLSNYKAYPYWIRQHVISYAYSARLWARLRRLRRLQPPPRRFLGVAPVFQHSQRQMAPLPHSDEQMQRLRDAWSGTCLLREQASKQRFLQEAPQYQLLHIHSHALSNAQTPLASYIAFYDEEDSAAENVLLYLAEIYAMNLQADMVVLSACETQTGALHKGEGLLSLGRGFMYAGCKSVIATRWSVNHASSGRLMDLFYQNLGRGQPKDVALANAKMDYLEDEQTDKQMAHPYFWAAYSPIGDMQPVHTATPWLKALGIFALAVLLPYILILLYRAWNAASMSREERGSN